MRHDPKTNQLIVKYVPQLRIYPHALREANAYYSPEKKALLFGYFPAVQDDPGRNLPGGMVFTCLSHDVVAHETTHALLDGLHRYFAEPSNPDVLAFHEGFADLCALFQHFNQPEALKDQIARTRGDLAGSENLLGQLAQQFGQAIGQHGSLRDAIGEIDPDTKTWVRHVPSPNDYSDATEAHARGAVLVAAIFDAYLAIYGARTEDLIRIATGGSGVLPSGHIHPDLVQRLAEEAAKIAGHFLRIVIRALDYCPPVDITFGEYLRALVSSDADLVPEDAWGYRIAIIEAFRRRGIYPRDVRTLAADALRWQEPDDDVMLPFKELLNSFMGARRPSGDRAEPTLEWQTTGEREELAERNRHFQYLTRLWIKKKLGKSANRYRDKPPDPGFMTAVDALGLTLMANALPTVYRSAFDGLPALDVNSVRVAPGPSSTAARSPT